MRKTQLAVQGSPPRVRGKAHGAKQVHTGNGITPARAGKSESHTQCGYTPQDHPRACGEKQENGYQIGPFSGSPPRVRGKGVLYLFRDLLMRITPARAGKSHIY